MKLPKGKANKPLMTKAEVMSYLSEKTGLNWDGGDDDRLFDDGYNVNMNVPAMGPEVYAEWEKAMDENTIKGEGFEVYAWNDGSGYEYWLAEGTNYQQITVYVKDFELALENVDTILDKVEELHCALSDFDRYSLEWTGFPTNEEIEAAQAELEAS